MAVSFVKASENAANSGTITFSPTNTGDLLVFFSDNSAGAGNGSITTVAGNVGPNFTALYNGVAGAQFGNASCFYLPNCPSGITSITATYNGGSTPGSTSILVVELTGAATSSPISANTKQNQVNPGTTTDAITSGTTNVGASSIYLLGVVMNGGDSDTVAGTGYTSRYASTNFYFVEDRSGSGTIAATATAATHGGADTYFTTLLAVAVPSAAAFIQTEWPNPIQPATRAIDLRTWTRSAPVTPNAIPIAQRDWPNPNLGKPFPSDLRGWIQDPIPTPNAIPIHQSEWPNPVLRVQNHELRSWIQDPIPVPNAIPIAQKDWPLPAPKPPNLELRSWIQGPAPSPGPIPNAQYDWPNPQPLPPNKELRSWIESPIPAPNPIPIAQLDWPNPQQPKRSIDALSWSFSFPPVAAATTPIIPLVWPNPVIAAQGSFDELRTWIQGIIGPSSTNFAQYDWPNPTLRVPNLDLRGWIQSPLSTPGVIPIAQLDWPNPVLRVPNLDLRGWIQSPQPTPNAIPNAQFDWPNPQLIRRSIDALTFTFSLPPIVLSSPFNQLDWPNPVLLKPNFDLRGWIQSPIAGAPPVVSSIDPWPPHWPMPPVSQAQLRKFIQQQRRAATRRARQIAAQVRYDEGLKADIERAVRGEIPIEPIAERVTAKPLSNKEVNWDEVKGIVSKLLEKPLQAVKKIQTLQVIDPEEEERNELDELYSLYAQDFYERLQTLQRLRYKKLN